MLLYFISTREKLADLCHFLYFNYQIFTEYLLCTKANIWNVMWRRNIRCTRPFFTTDVYTVTGDRGAKTQRQQDRQTHTHRKEARDKMLIWQYNQKTPKSGKAWPRWTDFITGGCSEGEGLEAWVELGETERDVWCTKQSRQEVQSLQPWVTVPGLKKKKATCSPMVTATLFTRARTWQQPQCPSRDDWIEKMWLCIHNGIWLSHKKEQTWVICRDVDGPQVCHPGWSKWETEKQILYINTYMHREKWYKRTYLQGRNRNADVENRLADCGMNWDRHTHTTMCNTGS